MLFEQLSDSKPYTVVSPELLKTLGSELDLPDGGTNLKKLADESPGGAFDPRKLEEIPAEFLGYKATWAVVRYPYYGLDWEITGLCLESRDPDAEQLPWVVIINGGSANSGCCCHWP